MDAAKNNPPVAGPLADVDENASAPAVNAWGVSEPAQSIASEVEYASTAGGRLRATLGELRYVPVRWIVSAVGIVFALIAMWMLQIGPFAYMQMGESAFVTGFNLQAEGQNDALKLKRDAIALPVDTPSQISTREAALKLAEKKFQERLERAIELEPVPGAPNGLEELDSTTEAWLRDEVACIQEARASLAIRDTGPACVRARASLAASNQATDKYNNLLV